MIRQFKYFIGISTIFISLTSFNFGSGTAFLKGKSESGKTILTVELQDIIGFLEKAELQIEDSKIIYKTEESNIVIDAENGVFTMYFNDGPDEDYQNHKYLKFWSIPSTFKIIRNERHYKVYEFKAKIVGTEPRENKESHTPTIELNCKLEYRV